MQLQPWYVSSSSQFVVVRGDWEEQPFLTNLGKKAQKLNVPVQYSVVFLNVKQFSVYVQLSIFNLPGSNFSHIYCFFFLVSFRISKFEELQFADVVSSAISLFPEEESDWVAFQSKKEKS